MIDTPVRGWGGMGAYLDIEEVLGEYWRSVINWDTRTIELATEHLNGDGHLEDITGELAMSVKVIDVGGTLKNLDDGSLAFNLEDLTLSHLSVSELDVDDLGVPVKIMKRGEYNIL